MLRFVSAVAVMAMLTLPVCAGEKVEAGKPVTAQDKNLRFAPHYFTVNKPEVIAGQTAQWVEPALINAWGIAIRPVGAGGHFWITAKDVSYEYVGDVQQSVQEKLRVMHTDKLKYVKLPVGGDDKFSTGVVYNDSATNFVITQELAGVEPITAPAKFLFASDGGIISAWTERKKPDGSFDRAGEALTVIDQSVQGAQFFGLTLSHGYDRLYAADFGAVPGIKVFDGAFKPLPLQFEQPFDTNHNGKVDAGEYAPFNIQSLTDAAGMAHLYVTYAKTQLCPVAEIAKESCAKDELWVGEEDTSKAGQGRVAEFTEEGKLVAVFTDASKLSAPWGVARAPAQFGRFSNALLVGNFGDGTIAAFDCTSYRFIDYLRDAKGKRLKIDKIWGLLFGNGESLGDKNALYFAAGPNDEKDGAFGVLRAVH
jgi:uncharacterized protein (TIGR03118 family)